MFATPDVLDAICAHGEAAYPEEGCGFLLGTVHNGRNHVEAVRRVENRRTEHRERRYAISADDYRAAQHSAAEHGLDVVGFYHSHPDHPAQPSATDLEEATFPGYTYAIVSVQEGTATVLTAWSLAPDRSRFEEEEIVRETPTSA